MSAHFTEMSQPCNVVPKGNQQNAQASLFQPTAKRFDLSTLSRAIDAGEAYKSGAPIVMARTNQVCSTQSSKRCEFILSVAGWGWPWRVRRRCQRQLR